VYCIQPRQTISGFDSVRGWQFSFPIKIGAIVWSGMGLVGMSIMRFFTDTRAELSERNVAAADRFAYQISE
jgi:hypothetical protein